MNMFSLSISASVILGSCAQADLEPCASTAAARSAQIDASLVTLSVMPSSSRRWAIDLFGAGTAEPDDTFDIRVGWGDGAYSELLGVPLGMKDTLVVDRSSDLRVYGICDEVVFPRTCTA